MFIKRGVGAYIIDADDTPYIDYVGSWGPLILGHAHASVISAVQCALQNSLSFGAPTEVEVKLAEKIIKLMPKYRVRPVSKFRYRGHHERNSFSSWRNRTKQNY